MRMIKQDGDPVLEWKRSGKKYWNWTQTHEEEKHTQKLGRKKLFTNKERRMENFRCGQKYKKTKNWNLYVECMRGRIFRFRFVE